MTSERATLFLDLDGPVLETSERHYRVHRAVATEFGGGLAIDREGFWARKRNGESSWAIAAATDLLPASAAAAFRQRWREEIESPAWLGLDAPQPGAKDWLAAAAGRHSLVLVTLRQSRAALEAQLDQLALGPFFDAILSAPSEPGRGAQRKAALMAAHGVPDRAVMIGDTEIDIHAGRRLGLPTVAVSNGIRDWASLAREHPAALVPDLPAVTAAVLAALLSLNPIDYHDPVR